MTTNQVMIHSGSVTRSRGRAGALRLLASAGREHRARRSASVGTTIGQQRKAPKRTNRAAVTAASARAVRLALRAAQSGPGGEVDPRVGNHDEREDDEARQEDAGDDGREVVKQLLEAEEVPGGLGGIGRLERVGDSLERSVEEDRDEGQSAMTTTWNRMTSRTIRCGKVITYRSSVRRTAGLVSGRTSATRRGVASGSVDSTTSSSGGSGSSEPPRGAVVRVLGRPLDAAVLADAPDVNGEEEQQRDRAGRRSGGRRSGAARSRRRRCRRGEGSGSSRRRAALPWPCSSRPRLPRTRAGPTAAGSPCTRAAASRAGARRRPPS